MKKFVCLFILLSMIMSGCAQKEGQAKKLIYDYYKKNRLVTSDAAVNLIKAKPYKNEYLVLAEYTQKDGRKYLDLLMVKKDINQYYVSREAQGVLPSDSDFSLNKLIFDDSTILFGTFNSNITQDKNTGCSKITIKLATGDSIEENIDGETGYIITVDKLSAIKDFTMLGREDNVLSTKNDLDKNASLVYITKFLLTR